MEEPPTTPTSREIPLIVRLRAATTGRYVIHGELGVGGMATVFRATEKSLEREVAIKVMALEMAATPGAGERFRREARVAAALSHPHIVPIYAIGEDPSLAFFVMKFIEGRGLDTILKQEGAQPIEEVARVIGVVGRALGYAHERGVVHRDVKPANIMVGNDGWTFVTDFGIAKRDEGHALTSAGTVIGTPAYMSPEQFNGLPVTGAADQYSLGIVAFEMLTGRAPFEGPSLGEIMRGHLLEDVPPIRTLRIDVPTAVAECVSRMLAKEPADRFPTLGDAMTALDEAASTLVGLGGLRGSRGAKGVSGGTSRLSVPPIARPSLTPAPQPARIVATAAPERSSAAPWLVALLLVLALAGGGAWYVFSGRLDGERAASTGAATTLAAGEDAGGGTSDSTSDPRTGSMIDTAGGVAGARGDTADPGGPDSAQVAPRPAQSLDEAINALQARVASAPTVDREAPLDSTVVRIGSQTFETVLFVNGRQVGIVGGRGLIETVVAPGSLEISVKRLNCRDWDTSFVALAGRRYTIGERSPSC